MEEFKKLCRIQDRCVTRMYKCIDNNNIEGFELMKNTVTKNTPWSGFKRLDSCYERPSYAKKRIYEFWESWFFQYGR